MLAKLNRSSLIFLGMLGVLLFYGLGSLSLDTGSLLHYLITLLVLIASVRFIVRGIKAKK